MQAMTMMMTTAERPARLENLERTERDKLVHPQQETTQMESDALPHA
jgi:hypothetical protein